jgi:glycosyltransferase involved in cell wall biosynthesis
MISIIMPTRNRAGLISRAVRSVQSQTMSDFELLIVDDGSMDNTEYVIQSIGDTRIRYLKNEKPLGACASRNIGIREARGEYIAFLDSDDEWLPEKLSIDLNKIKTDKSDITCSCIERVNGISKERIPKKNIDPQELKKKILNGNIISLITLFGVREVFLSENFDERLGRFQDWDLLIRLTMRYRISFEDVITARAYVQDDSITKDNIKAIESMQQIIEKYQFLFSNKQRSILFYSMGNFCKDNRDEERKSYYAKALKNNILNYRALFRLIF